MTPDAMKGSLIRSGAPEALAGHALSERMSRGWGGALARAKAAAAFLTDARWWLIGLAGLLGDAALRFAAPQLLASSALHGAGQWLWCVLWLPAIEEGVFRGVLQGELLQTRRGRSRVLGLTTANLGCSVLFVALHFLHHPAPWALSVFVPSLVLGWLRERHATVASPIAMHALFNLTFFAAASLGTG